MLSALFDFLLPKGMSVEEFQESLSPLPETIDSLQTLKTYVEHYTLASHEQIVLNKPEEKPVLVVSTGEYPCLRIGLAKENYRLNPTFERTRLLFEKPLKAILSSVNTSEVQYTEVYLHLVPYNASEKNKLKTQFERYLISNHQELLPNYRPIFQKLRSHIVNTRHDAFQFLEKTKTLTESDIAVWFGLDNFNKQHRDALVAKTTYINNDLTRLANTVNFFTRHIDTIQLLDLYLFAEQSFEILSFMEKITKDMIESGNFLLANVNNRKSDIGKFFKHRQFPLRSLYLLSRSIAFSMRDFADKFRSLAKLPPIPDEIFSQSDYLKSALEIDESLKDVDAFIAENQKQQRDAWLSDTLLPSFLWQKEVREKRSQKQTLKTPKDLDITQRTKGLAPLKPKIRIEKSQLKVPNAPAEDTQNTSLSEKDLIAISIHKQLDTNLKIHYTNLFSEKALTARDADDLIDAVYRALINLNEAKLAALFLNQSIDIKNLRFTKKRNGMLDNAAMAARMTPFFKLNIVHPDFAKKRDSRGHHPQKPKTPRLEEEARSAMEQALIRSEPAALQAQPAEKRVLIVELAHSWHKLALSHEYSKEKDSAQVKLIQIHQKIVALLNEALPLVMSDDSEPVTILEGYLFNYYLHVDVIAKHEILTDKEIDNIQKEVYENLKHHHDTEVHTIPVVDERGTLLDSLQVKTIKTSVFHIMTNNQLGDFLIVKLSKAIKDQKLPLFITYNGQTYRTDVMGGSPLKPKMSKNDFGGLIAVSLRAAQLLKRWFTSYESFWYGYQAFMSQTAGKTNRAASGELVVETISDNEEFVVQENFIVQDGFGYIKASVAATLGLERPKRLPKKKEKNVAYQMLHSFLPKENQAVVNELFSTTMRNLQNSNLQKMTVEELANAFMGTPPKRIAIGIPTKDDGATFPDDPIGEPL